MSSQMEGLDSITTPLSQ